MFLRQSPYACELKLTPLAAPPPSDAMLLDAAALSGAAILDSSADDPSHGRYTVLACGPLEVIELRDDKLTDSGDNVLATGEAIWPALESAFACVRLTRTPAAAAEAGYLPGWIGYLGYELARYVEKLPARAKRESLLPDLRLAFHDALLIYDAQERCWTLVELQFPQAHTPVGAGLAARELAALLQAHAARPPALQPPQTKPSAHPSTVPSLQALSDFEPQEYQAAVQRCIDYIAAGDIFQVNLSQRLRARSAPSPRNIYAALRRRNPSWYGAFFQFDCPSAGGPLPCAIISSSPELFLRVRGRHVLTRPIKGTRRRCGDETLDRQARQDLQGSPKDNAELAMIIDLLRNDLGRVCCYGSVRVTQRCVLEEHPTVYHLVGSVQGDLRPDVGPASLLRATFPGGSITGAPKVRAMEIIDELEPVTRGVYTGCIGIVGVDGSCEWNIAIRTVVWENGTAFVQAGGGIVADSTPQAEYQETLDKARALLEAINLAASAPPA